MSGHIEDVLESVIIRVKETTPPTHIVGLPTQPCRSRDVAEYGIPVVMEEVDTLVREVGFEQVKPAIVVIVCGRDAHTGLPHDVLTETHAAQQAFFAKRAIAIVHEQQSRRRIAGHIDVGPAVIIEISSENTQAIKAFLLEDSRCGRDIAEGAIAIVVIERACLSNEPARAAIYCQTAKHAVGVGTRVKSRLERKIHIMGNKEIKLSVAVVIEEGASGTPAFGVTGDIRFAAHFGKGAVAVVTVEQVFSPIGDKNVLEAVVVVVADADTLSPAGMGQASFFGYVGEGSVAIVPKKFVAGRRPLQFEARAVDQEDIKPAVVVVIDEGHAGPRGLEDVFFRLISSAHVVEIKMSIACDVLNGIAERGARLDRRGFGFVRPELGNTKH